MSGNNSEWIEVRRRLVHGRVKRCYEMAVCGEWEIQEVLRDGEGNILDIRDRYEDTKPVDVGRFSGGTGDELAYLFRMWVMAQQALELRVTEAVKQEYEFNTLGEVVHK